MKKVLGVKIHLFLLGTVFVANGLIWYAVSAADQNGRMTVAFLNIGQGDSIFIESPSGEQMLVDGGPGSAVLTRLGEVMPFFDHTIDVVLATHPDSDHISGLIDVLKRYQVNYVIMTEATSSTATFKALSEAVIASGATVIHPRRGMIIDLGAGADFRVLFPDRSMADVADNNSGSIVGRVEYGGESFLLTGDAPSALEHYLVSLGVTDLKSDVLKVGHHGSKNSSSAEFVSAVAPTYAAISVGVKNRYGHPTKEAMDNISAVGAKILRTDELGTIIFKTDGESLDLSYKP